jgi:Siphovirus Gp157
MNLYTLSVSFAQLQDMVDNEEVELDVVQDTLEAINVSVEEKFENISKLIKNLSGKVEMFKGEEKRIATKRKSMENKIDWLKNYMLTSLDITGKTKVEVGTFTVRKQKNPKSIVISEGAKIPEQFLIPQEPKVDTKLVKEAVLKQGMVIEGVEEAPETFHIRIQ